MDYARIKKTARALGCTVKDLIALAPKNDPFYTGSPAELAKARWFAELWQRFGGQEAHIRRIHYRTQAFEPPILKPDGKLYDSRLDYFAQLDRYKAHREGNGQ